MTEWTNSQCGAALAHLNVTIALGMPVSERFRWVG